MTEKPSIWIRQSEAAKLRGVSKQAILYIVNRVRAGKSNQKLRLKTIAGLSFLHREDVVALVFDAKKTKNKP